MRRVLVLAMCTVFFLQAGCSPSGKGVGIDSKGDGKPTTVSSQQNVQSESKSSGPGWIRWTIWGVSGAALITGGILWYLDKIKTFGKILTFGGPVLAAGTLGQYLFF
jgi:hypothetical protein